MTTPKTSYRTGNQETTRQSHQAKSVNKVNYKLYKDIIIPVMTIPRITAKAMLPPSYHPSLIPCNRPFELDEAKFAIATKNHSCKGKKYQYNERYRAYIGGLLSNML